MKDRMYVCVSMMRIKKGERNTHTQNPNGMGLIMLRAKGGANGNEKNERKKSNICSRCVVSFFFEQALVVLQTVNKLYVFYHTFITFECKHKQTLRSIQWLC